MKIYKVFFVIPAVIAVFYYTGQRGQMPEENVVKMDGGKTLKAPFPVKPNDKDKNVINVAAIESNSENTQANNKNSGYVLTDSDDSLSFLREDHADGRRYLAKSEVATVVAESKNQVIRLKGARFVLDSKHVPYISDDKEYVYIQLKRTTSEETRAHLANIGVELSHYVDKNTWLVNVSNDQLQQLSRMDSIYALGERDLKDKVSPEILERGVREIVDDSDRYALIVEVLNDGELSALREQLLSKNIVDSAKRIKPFGQTSLEIEVLPSDFEALANINIISWIEYKPGENTFSNVDAAALSNIDDIRDNFGLNGNGLVLGVWDAGTVDNHMDLVGRLTNQDTGNVHWHATHVAGTMIGDGNGDLNALGMAPAANLEAFDWTNDNAEMRDAANNLQVVVSNHSYGTLTGWNWDGTQWVFNNNQGDFGDYDARAREWDDIVVDTNLVVVKAAGNDRGDGPAVAVPGQPDDGGATGFDTIATYGNAKNIITVGATTDVGNMTNFSGWGPANDGRIKPDIVANGISVFSTDLNNQYTNLSGTSMSSPVVSGAAALLIQRFNQVFGVNPQASLLKAVLLHTATDQGSFGPDYDTGWGLLDAQAAIDLINQGALHLFNRDIRGNQVQSFSFLVDSDEQDVKVTMVWTDPRAAVGAAQTLVNDLDIRLVSPSGTQFLPWVKDANNPANAAIRGDNEVDNIEQVVVEDPEVGLWTANITGEINQGTVQQVSIAISVPELGADTDNDWLSDDDENAMGLDPFNADIDNDGLTDYQEACFDGNCSNYLPFSQGGGDTDAYDSDTDNDNVNDGDEVALGRSPVLNEPALIVIVTSLLMSQ